MPRYHLPNGKTVWSDREIKPEEMDDFIAFNMQQEESPVTESVQPKKEESGFLSKLWSSISEPLTDLPSQAGRALGNIFEERRRTSDNPFLASITGFYEGASEGLGDVLSGLTSPINMAASMAGMPSLGRGLRTIGRLASGATALHGSGEILSPESTMSERGFGLAELAGGMAGVRGNIPKIGESIKKSITREADDILPSELGNREGNILTPEELITLRERVYKRSSEQELQEAVDYYNRNILERKQYGTPGTLSDIRNITVLRKELKHRGKEHLLEPEPFSDVHSPPEPTSLSPRELQVLNKPRNIINEGTDIIDTSTGEVIDTTISSNPQLPRDLKGAKPRYNMGQNSYEPIFESDIDRALFIIAQKTPSKRNADYLKFVMDHTGLNEKEALQAGIEIRNQIKNQLKNSEPGQVNIPTMFQLETQSGAPPIKPPNKPPIINSAISSNPQTGEPISPSIKPKVKLVSNTNHVLLENPNIETIQQMNDNGYYSRRVDKDTGFPIMEKRTIRPDEPDSRLREIYNLPRGMMSVDLPFMTSAAFRQASPLIGTKHWFKAWDTSFRSFGAEESFQNVMNKIHNSPLFKKRLDPINKGKLLPSYAELVGLDLSDLKGLRGREESLRSTLAEKIPLYGKYIRASNRAYTGFLNDLRANTFQSLYDDADAMGFDPRNNLILGRQIADFINDATGRGKLSTKIPFREKELSLEKNAQLLSDIFFAPKLIARDIRMLNPLTYRGLDPMVRKQYMYGMLRRIGTWGTMASLAGLAGADVSLDPTNSDFGKIKIGNTRFDFGSGLQQYLVLGAREGTGQVTSSVTGRTREMGVGYKPPTHIETALKFGSNKLHPIAKFAWDLMSASEYGPVNVMDRMFQIVLPMYTSDLKEIINEHPELAPLVLGLSSIGVGSQTYEDKPEPSYIPKEWDYQITGGSLWR